MDIFYLNAHSFSCKCRNSKTRKAELIMYQICNSFYNRSSTPGQGWREEEWWQWRPGRRWLCSSSGWSRRRSGNHHSPSPPCHHPSLFCQMVSMSKVSRCICALIQSEQPSQGQSSDCTSVLTLSSLTLSFTHPCANAWYHKLNKQGRFYANQMSSFGDILIETRLWEIIISEIKT